MRVVIRRDEETGAIVGCALGKAERVVRRRVIGVRTAKS
jgi:hypothetical protein